MPKMAVRKKIVKVYPRELLQTKGMSPEKFEELRAYSAEKRKQIIAEAIREQQAVSLKP